MEINLQNSMIVDLHLHSRFSRACSKNITIPELVKWARVKGLDLLGTSDFTHPIWFEEIKKYLKSNDKGFYYYEDEKGKFPFIISGEVSLMYTQERGRRIHLVLLIPSIEVAEKINGYFDAKGRRDYDGRPIFKIPGDEFVKDMMKISKAIEIIPAHIWTPWFGVFGSKSGFDSLKDCFKDQIENIHAIETGMSSDPIMNWRIKELGDISIVSFSDSHSFWPWRLGREATICKKTDSYFELIEQIRKNSFIGTIETDPGYGIYHYDGHRDCGFSCSPEETKKLEGICPKCKKPLTIGVENRVEELASFEYGVKNENSKPFFKLLPLHEVISLCFGGGLNTKKIWDVYKNLIRIFKTEFNILLNVSEKEFLENSLDKKLIELILRNREGKINVKPGYDGVYGVPVLDEQEKLF